VTIVTADDPIDRIRALLSGHGARTGPARRVIMLLCDGHHRLADLVKLSAVPRRGVEELLSALGDDVLRDGDSYRIVPARTASYSEVFGPRSHCEPDLTVIRSDVDSVPPPLSALDHVQATPDKRILEYVDERARSRGLAIRCLHADLRFGLPPAVTEWADLVFSDPPYTPEGMALFASRGIESLRDTAHGRILLAYGFSDRTPALGLKVQQELLRLGLVFEAILPGFHSFDGAQAIGSAADLYVCQATSRGKKTSKQTAIYTHGSQSIESTSTVDTTALLAFTGTREVRGPDWSVPVGGKSVTVGASADPGPWLLRILLAYNADRLAVLVPNNHPDLRDERGQRALTDLIGTKYRLRFHRSTPDSRHAVVIAERQNGGELLSKAHGKLGNVWREALIAESGGQLTKREARDVVASKAPFPEDLELRLIDLPRHRIAGIG
jgi:N4-bis(aminopropyl)spermidine synthase